MSNGIETLMFGSHPLEILAFGAFWFFVIGLDLAALWNLRLSRIEATARVLWTIWIVVAPIVGPISFFIVQPPQGERGTQPRDSLGNEPDPEQRRWSENIRL